MIDLCALRVLLRDLQQVEDHMKKEVGLTFTEASTLCAIEKGNDAPAAIAAAMGLSPSRASRLIMSLENKGMLIRCPSMDDKRVVNLGLTAKGKNVLDKFHHCDTCLPRYIEEALIKGQENE
ncbi:MAG: MarR family winged helix-turn-helix transcriptional regulator [Spirochaetia bacterium]|jgi:DNA-binding MarR family transcriptional regulator|nr:MarR family winged helix-turn-helix transcriptional regulator [Spirochaetia bacterium]